MKKINFKKIVLLCAIGAALSISSLSYANEDLKQLEFQTFGRSYANEPVEQRLQRLEAVMNVHPDRTDTAQARVAGLFGIQQSRISEDAEQAAIQAYNLGVDLAAQGQTEAALQAYQQATQINPRLMPAYNNWASLLEQKQDFIHAIEIYQRAMSQVPKEPLLHRNVGVLYERIGRVQEAIQEYEIYLSLINHPDPPIESIVSNFKNNQIKGELENDYVAFASNATEGRKLLWPERLVPIPVYLQLTSADQSTLLPAVLTSFDEWATATKGRIKFREVTDPKQARIRIILKPGPLSDPFKDVAHTQYDADFDSVQSLTQMQMSITVNTGDGRIRLPEADRANQVHRLVLHEIGHAIGIWGHSLDPGDIMYTHPITSHLSQRDVVTIQKLYGIDGNFLGKVARREQK